jgi:hypothetical protein
MPTWYRNLDDASTVKDVVAVCNQFVTAWTFAELGQLPAACWPKSAIEAEDVGAYALRLITQLDNGDAATAPRLHRMSTFFTKAALRLLEVTASRPTLLPDPHNTDPRAL